MFAGLLKYQVRQSAVSLRSNCCVLQTNSQPINKNSKFALKLGVIPKMNDGLLKVKCRQDCKKGEKIHKEEKKCS